MKILTKLQLDTEEMAVLEKASQLLLDISTVDEGDFADNYFYDTPTIQDFYDLSDLLRRIVEQNRKENY